MKTKPVQVVEVLQTPGTMIWPMAWVTLCTRIKPGAVRWLATIGITLDGVWKPIPMKMQQFKCGLDMRTCQRAVDDLIKVGAIERRWVGGEGSSGGWEYRR